MSEFQVRLFELEPAKTLSVSASSPTRLSSLGSLATLSLSQGAKLILHKVTYTAVMQHGYGVTRAIHRRKIKDLQDASLVHQITGDEGGADHMCCR